MAERGDRARDTRSGGAALPRRSRARKEIAGPVAPVDGTGQSRGTSRGLVTLGALLIAGLTVLAFGGGRLFGEATGGDPPPERPVVGQITATDSSPATAMATSPTPVATPEPTSRPAVPTVPPPPATWSGGRAPIVCIDPGHGGPTDRGRQPLLASAYSGLPGVDEATLVLEQAWDLEARLVSQGVTVVMTRRADEVVNRSGADVNGDGKTGRDGRSRGGTSYGVLDELQARIAVCNAAQADLLVSMHINGFDRPSVQGYEAWYTKERPFWENSYRFGTLVYRGLKAQLAGIGYVLPEADERGVQPDTKLTVDTEQAEFNHLVLLGPAAEGKIDPSRMPGALVEALFITNDEDAAILTSGAGRDAIVTAYEVAIITYFKEHPPR